MKETTISREKAQEILGEDYIEEADYYVVTTDEGEEQLWCWGYDEPEVTNQTTTSWL